MSYDYTALVTAIAKSRRQAAEATTNEDKLPHLQEAVDTCATLSTHCPMTPLLWMQYSVDTAELLQCLTHDATSGRSTRLQMLELALAEFPGSAILQLHYLQLLCGDENGTEEDSEKVEAALASAIYQVGRGSHRNEGVLVAAIYKLTAEFYVAKEPRQALATLVQRSRIPMKDVNQTLTTETRAFFETNDISPDLRQETLLQIEDGRRYEAKTYSSLVTCEDEVDAVMHNDGILSRHQVDLEELNWKEILKSDGKTFWMGFGSMATTEAFIQYAQRCYRFRSRIKEDMEEDEKEDAKAIENTINSLGLSVFERGVAECPTAEVLWSSYIRHLLFLVQSDQSLVSRLKSVADRSVRNCPYSLSLYQQKLQLHGTLADRDVAVFDPDELQKTVQEALDAKFIASKEACLELYMTLIQVMRRRILSQLAKAPINAGSAEEPAALSYDESEPFKPNETLSFSEWDDSTSQEIEDLCDDFRDLYDAIDSYLRKSHGSWSEGRARLWTDRAYTETHLLTPLSACFADDVKRSSNAAATEQISELLRCYDKLTKVFQPAQPDSYMNYIHTFMTKFPSTTPTQLIARVRRTRFLFERALHSVGKAKNPTAALDPFLERDFDSGLRNLCHQYLAFERFLGSEQSLTNASKAIQKKLYKLDSLECNDATGLKRTLEGQESSEGQPSTKRARGDSIAGDITKTPTEHKVKIGKLEYPAHPFTVRIGNLSDSTEDMDLVDCFLPKCGAIVHARILREKHRSGMGKSKGRGLIQFELVESVDKALELSGGVQIHEKAVEVERSPTPAVIGVIPAGVYHANQNKGQKQDFKNHQRHKDEKDGAAPGENKKDGEDDANNIGGTAKPKPSTTNASSGFGALAFRPRGVNRGQKHRKVKVAIVVPKAEPKMEE